MKQYTISSILEHLFDLHYNYICSIKTMIQGPNSDNPPYGSTHTNNIKIQIHGLSGQDRVNRSALYNENVSHEAFMIYTEDVTIGSEIVLTHRILEKGTQELIKDQDQKTFKVTGITQIYGIPEPDGQILLDLSETSAI